MTPIPESLKTNGRVAIADTTIADFATQLRGLLVQPGDAGYEEARTIYNGMIDKRPRYIVQCRDVADVVYAVNFARENNLLLAIRGGGHNGPGLALCDDGLVIDLSAMRGVRVDPEARTVRVEGGAQWGDVDHATHAFGMATVIGIISTTGVGGLTLGGGHGYLTRTYGLTIDNLLGADVVLADGQRVHASKEGEPGPVLGAAGRRREFWRRHVVQISAPSGEDRDRRADVLDARRPGAHPAVVPRLASSGAEKRVRFLPRGRGAGPAVSGGTARRKGLWPNVVLPGPGNPGRGCSGTGPRRGRSPVRAHRVDALPGAPESVRCPLPVRPTNGTGRATSCAI